MVVNKINGKRYVGMTSLTAQKRWKKHVDCALREKRDTFFYNAIRKYGPDNFYIGEIEEIDEDEAGLAEVHYIKKLKSFYKDGGYNSNKGGFGGCKGYKHTDEARRLISLWSKSRIVTDETKTKLSLSKKGSLNPNFGKQYTDAEKKIWSEMNSGSNNPRAKTYEVFFPDGHKEIVNDRKLFCSIHDLKYFSVCSATRLGKPYKKFLFKEIKE